MGIYNVGGTLYNRYITPQEKEEIMSRERELGTIVHTLEPIATLALIRSKLGNPDADIRPEPMVVVNGKNGLATVITEGVGWFADKNGGIPINFYAKNGYGSGGYVDVSEEELRGVISAETIDLAEHIRTFGDRLETNFYIWQQYAKGYDQTIMSVATATIEA